MNIRAIALPLSLCAAAAWNADGPPAFAQVADHPSAQAIMDSVAANQDKSEAERKRYVYVQHTRMASRKGNTVRCEELTDYRITPSSDGSDDVLLKLDGRLLVKGKYVTYDRLEPETDRGTGAKGAPDGKGQGSKAAEAKNHNPNEPDAQAGTPRDKTPDHETQDKKPDNTPGHNDEADDISVRAGGEGLDRDLVENIRKGLMQDKSRDGLNAHLFPLTSKEEALYVFQFAGRERLNGRDVFHITFRPKDKDEFGWMGDAYIDTTAYQPVMVTTAMARKIPFAVRTLLGTNVPGLGFTVIYAAQPDGVWFPTSFSSEFKIHVLYFFHRDIVLDAQNREFEKTHSDARILQGMTPIEPEKP